MAEDRFLSRWARRKAQARAVTAPAADPPAAEGAQLEGDPVSLPAAQEPATETIAGLAEAPKSPSAPTVASAAADEPPVLTLADVARLTRDSDFSPFVAGGVQTEVKNAALRRLFSDPHFNEMDGLDVYIADYNAPDPLPRHALLQMAQARFLGFLKTEAEQLTIGDAAPTKARVATGANSGSPALSATGEETANAANEDTDLQLQPHDAAGRAEPDPGAGGNDGHEP